MSKRIWIALFFSLASLVAAAQNYTFQGVKPAVVIDVRTPEEYAVGHIEGALNIPFDQIAKGIRSIKGLTKDQTVLVYCRTGRRSEIAKAALEQEGYKRVLDGGAIDDLARNLNACTPRIC